MLTKDFNTKVISSEQKEVEGLGLFGMFGKKQPDNFKQQVQVAPEQTGLSELPDIPPIEDLDLPPPPAYPSGKNIPIQADSAPSELFTSETPFEFGANAPENPSRYIEPKIVDEKITVEDFKPADKTKGPAYVRMEDYRIMLEGTGRIKDNLGEAADLVIRLNELKNEEDREFEKWRTQLEDIQRKLTYIDKVIFESR